MKSEYVELLLRPLEVQRVWELLRHVLPAQSSTQIIFPDELLCTHCILKLTLLSFQKSCENCESIDYYTIVAQGETFTP